MPSIRKMMTVVVTGAFASPSSPAARISWDSEIAIDDSAVSRRGDLIEAANFGNSFTTSPVVNGVSFQAIDFTSGARPNHLAGLSYRTGENGKFPGAGIHELFDTIAYRSGVNPQSASLTGLEVGQVYEVQFFYYHDTVNRSVTIRDPGGGEVVLQEGGLPLVASGIFTADGEVQPLVFEANVGSQFFNGYQLRRNKPEPPEILDRVIISEVMASNGGALLDGQGRSPDWIEIWNSTTSEVNLAGWALSRSPTLDDLWFFPELVVAPNGYLIVFASGDERGEFEDELHADFTLPREGGTLLLLKPGEGGKWDVVSGFSPYPSQQRDISYGYVGGSGEQMPAYLETPTPGKVNPEVGFSGFNSDVSVQPERGFFDHPVDVVLEVADEAATIYYTLDGSEPVPGNGVDYQRGSGIRVAKTTTLRAAAHREGFRPGKVATHTYLFASDVVDQPQNPAGFPLSWTGADYAMEDNPEHLALIAGDAGMELRQAKEVVRNALLELPALSLVMNADDWFDPQRGIYANSTSRGMAWERACSAELLFPTGKTGTPAQIDCGVRVQGNTSRNATANPKYSLRLAFRGEYGEAKWRYPLFGSDASQEFDTIVLRSNSQDAWVYNTNRNRLGQFVRDSWARETHRRMGHASPDGTWVHLFINGLYWGVYNPTERPDAAHGAAYYGADKGDWDAIKNHQEVLDGNREAHRELLQLVQVDPDNWNAGYRDLSSPEAYAEVAELLDLEMMIDYLIHNMYAAADDWPGNYYMGYDRTGQSGGWRFFDWDNEHGMKNPVDLDRTGPHQRDRVSPTKFHHALKVNPEYRLLFADRVHRAFFNGGVLFVDPDHPEWDSNHPERNVPAALWMELTGGIERALIAESARWGDYRRARPYTVFDDFQSLRTQLLTNWFPRRSAAVLQQFRNRGLYPEVAAPILSRRGGMVEEGTLLEISGPENATVYYTTDGRDPYLAGQESPEVVLLEESASKKARVASADLFASPWREVGFDDSLWPEGHSGVGFEIIPSDYQDLIGLPVRQMLGANQSVLIRVPFELTDEQRTGLTSLSLRMRYDDGFVACLNGVEVASANAPRDGLDWQSGATAAHPDELAVSPVTFDISRHLGSLRTGSNVLAIHGLNDGISNGDFLIMPRLVAGGVNGLSPEARIVEGPVVLQESGQIRARSRLNGEWSALAEASFVVGEAAGPENLVISEIMYHAEQGRSHDFVELMNPSDSSMVHLGGVAFTEGIRFEFPFGTELAPGGRILVVADRLSFEDHYGTGLVIAGQYEGNLDNGGERLVLRAANGMIIREFSYDDGGNWPRKADGQGRSLVLIKPEASRDHALPFNWRESAAQGGNPGTSDVTIFEGNANEDRDGDSLPALLEYAMGLSDQDGFSSDRPAVVARGEGLALTYLENPLAEDVEIRVEASADLQTWTEFGEEKVRILQRVSGGRYRITVPITPDHQRYWRLRAIRP